MVVEGSRSESTSSGRADANNIRTYTQIKYQMNSGRRTTSSAPGSREKQQANRGSVRNERSLKNQEKWMRESSSNR